jgi:exopolysaccharide biosynthesis polyprenyl glycosylphosphotransferase
MHVHADDLWRWEAAVALISLPLAYFTSYALIHLFGMSFEVTFGKLPAGIQGWLFWGSALACSVLFACWKIAIKSRLKGIPVIWLGLGMEAGFLAILVCLYRWKFMPRDSFTFFLLSSLLYLPMSWLVSFVVLRTIRSFGWTPRDSRILVIGSGTLADQVIRAIRDAREGHEILGCLEAGAARAGTSVDGAPILGPAEMLPQYLFAHPVDLVVFALPLGLVPNSRALMDAAVELGVPVAVISDGAASGISSELASRDAFLESLLGRPAVILSNVRRSIAYLTIKRLLDVAISAILLAVLSPLLVMIAVLVKVTSPGGPVLYAWKVLGRNRRPFVGYKFRTMVPNADELKKQLLQQNEMQGPVFKMRNDPRITRLGRFLRKYSLDELPQLYSVLKGDMSLVGPRPPAKEEADEFQFWQRRKLSVTPGITCLWQVNGRSNIKSFDEWARLDLEYIRNASLWLDLAILLRTVPVVILGRGAH